MTGAPPPASTAELPRSADVVVIGSGIVGVTTAAALAERGARVVVLDKEAGPAREGSGRAQGSLRVQGRHPSELPLAIEAMARWQQAASADDDLSTDHPDTELTTGGNLYFALEPSERSMLLGLAEQARTAGLTEVTYLPADRIRQLGPAATGDFIGALWSPYDAQAQPAAATSLYLRRAERAGAQVHYGAKVTRIETTGARVTAVVSSRGSITTPAVVVATGVWSAHLLAGVGIQLPLMPVCLTELQTEPLPPLFAPSVRAFGFGARQRPDGRLVVSGGLGAVVTRRASLYDLNGLRYWLPLARTFRKNLRVRLDGRQVLRELAHATTLDARLVPAPAPELRPDRRSVDTALGRLAAVFPAAAGARVQNYWGGLIDMTPDGLPVIDHRPHLNGAKPTGSSGPNEPGRPGGLTVVTGLCGHGLAIGPVLGEIAADLTLTGATTHDIAPFRLDRFRGQVAAPEVMI